MFELPVAVAGGVVVGVALGLTGGGGSIFAMPILIYLLDVAPISAVPISLAAVALTASTGALHAARQRLPVWPAAAAFALGGIAGAPAGVALAHRVGNAFIVGGFAGLALCVGLLMWWRSLRRPAESAVVRALPAAGDEAGACRLADDGRLRFTAPCALVLAAAGVGAGVLSGLFGVGGGFIIVPVLAAVTQMGIHRAVATSLVTLSAIGFAGAAGAILQGSVSWHILLPFTAGGVGGMLAGRAIAARLAGPLLQRTFATAIVVVAVVMAVQLTVSG